MSLEKIKNFFKQINVKLTFLFILIFLVSSLISSGFAFFSIYTTIKQEDEQYFKRKLLSYWAQFQSDGIEDLIDYIKNDSNLIGDKPFFIRIADFKNTTIALINPHWKEYNLESLETYDLDKIGNSFNIYFDSTNFELEVRSIELSNEYILQIGMSTENRRSLLNLYSKNFIALILLLLALGIITGLIITSNALSPLKSLTKTVKRIIQTGNLSDRVEEKGTRDDLEELIVLFNKMLERIEELIRGMKGTLDTVSHDLRTPMTRFRGIAELALQEKDNPEAYKEALYVSLEESEKILSMLNSLMDISEAETGILKLNLELIDLDQTLKDLVEMYNFIGEEKNIKINYTYNGPKTIEADPIKFRQAIANLLDNATKFSTPSSEINLNVKSNSANIIIEIIDSGPGIPVDEIPFIWDRLFKGSSKKSGLGLGLSLVKAIIISHNAKIDIKPNNPPKKGTTFFITWPLT